MIFNEALINKYMFEGHFGLEKESLRIDENGYLSHSPHPFVGFSNIDRDFCENQIEIITDVHDSVDAVYEQLEKLHKFAAKKMYSLPSGKEYIWNFSNPPYLRNEEDIPVAKFYGEMRDKEIYREYLATKYGKKKMLFSGIHFNFSFGESYLDKVFKYSKFDSFIEFKNDLYLNLAKKLTKYSWLVIYLTAASPLFDGSYINEQDLGKSIISKYASARCSEIGYWNDFIPVLDYQNIRAYIKSIEQYIESGQLKTPAELYYPVRIKPSGKFTLENFAEKGVSHIEIRCIDLNPLSEIGLIKKDVEFLHLLIIYLNALPTESFEDYEQVMAIKNAKRSAIYDDINISLQTGWDENISIREAALDVLRRMEGFFDMVGVYRTKEIIEYQKNKLNKEDRRYVDKIIKTHKSYVKNELDKAEHFANKL